MGIFKRGTTYWYHFWFSGQHIQESTKQGNPRLARNMEAAHRTALAKGEVGFREKKPMPTLAEFCQKRIEPWAKATFEQPSRKTWLWYRTGLRSIYTYLPLAAKRIDQITGEHVADFAAHRQAQGLQVASVNSSLQVLRRCLRLAVEWGIVPAAPRVKLLRGATRRERVVSADEEARYLSVAPEPLASIAMVLLDTGLRPEECFRLRWESINFSSGKHGLLLVTCGKTAAARRVLPLTPRVRFILESRWNGAGKPDSGWVWSAPTASGHAEPSTIRKQHANTFTALEKNKTPLRPFVLYSLRHTFLTRLGESGCNVWTLARIAGHSSISMSARYVHPGDEAVLSAMSRLQEPILPASKAQGKEPSAAPLPPSTVAKFVAATE